MNLSFLAIVLWAASFFGNAVLLTALVVRQRWRIVPWFTAWILFHLVFTLTLFAAYRIGTKHLYTVLYWAGACIDLVLQVSIVVEIAGYVYRRGGSWVGGSRKKLVVSGVLSGIAAIAMGWAMSPAATSRLEALQARVDLGATVIITFFFTAVLVMSHQLGLSWRSLVLREGYGVAAWSVFAFTTDTLHAYPPMTTHFKLLDQLQIVGYLGVLGYWIVVFWLPESAPLVPTLEQEKSMESLMRKLE